IRQSVERLDFDECCSQRRLAMVDVADRPHVQVGLGAFKLFFAHDYLDISKALRKMPRPENNLWRARIETDEMTGDRLGTAAEMFQADRIYPQHWGKFID